MSSTVVVLLPPSKLSTGWELPVEQAQDLGSYTTLEVQFEVLTAGTGTGGETLELTHCATKDGEYLPLASAAITIDNTAASQHKPVANFLRFLRARTQGTVAGSPVVGIIIVAKNG